MFEKMRIFFRMMKLIYAAHRGGPDKVGQAIEKYVDDEFKELFTGIRRPLSGVPPAVAAHWRDPEGAADAANTATRRSFRADPLAITVPHISLLRHMHFTWDPAETGAPMLDPERPYGTAALLEQLRGMFPGEEDHATAQRHVEMMFVLERALAHGFLDPGDYAVQNLYPRKQRSALSGADGLSDADLGWIDARTVRVGEQHIKLLRAICVRWPSTSECEDRLARNVFPAASCDAKRPYGDMTAYMVDMTRILGLLDSDLSASSDNDSLHLLHLQMLPVMQVFVEHCRLEPDTYSL
jgi:hypothetical protein